MKMDFFGNLEILSAATATTTASAATTATKTIRATKTIKAIKAIKTIKAAKAAKGDQIPDGIHHTQTGAQDGHQAQAFGQFVAGGPLQWCPDLDLVERRVGQRLVADEPADLADELAELLGIGGLISQERQLLEHGGMLGNEEVGLVGHGRLRSAVGWRVLILGP